MRWSQASWLTLAFALSSACETPPDAPSEAVAHEPRWSSVTRPRDLSLLEAPALVVHSPEGEARVSASHMARVVRVHVRAGDTVQAGAPIVDVVMPAVLEAAARWVSVGPRRTLRTARTAASTAVRMGGSKV